ncbi:hypothetical protein FEM48_Zijuj11G0153800 [Ziziphus jujuba var. spinosa]|uniref:SH3 domain-containing protein n=1 Tax=Ziziphus jujuba var. spinosa TaxID=714518 RepID=A0A978UJQ8_ZIZJJ|nr:hypothetical protein FEM48_Zijuj11G0153800 [Ziziphus jujuba var. spinosa]
MFIVLQAVLRPLGSLDNDAVMVDEAEILCHQQLQNLYNSTREAKEYFCNVPSVRKLAEDCCTYESENQSTHAPLARASINFGTSHNAIEKEREDLLNILNDQVCELLWTQINGAPLEDARHLAYYYDKLCQDVEAQSAEAKLADPKSFTVALGREATAVMLSVEDQQQQMTFHRLLTMVNAERAYHQHALGILEKLHAEMTLERQSKEFSSVPMKIQRNVYEWLRNQDNNSHESDDHQGNMLFIAKVIHQCDAEAEGELSLSVDDYVVVRQVAPHGWSEGECNGKAGWFPSAYIERQEKAPTSKIAHSSL